MGVEAAPTRGSPTSTGHLGAPEPAGPTDPPSGDGLVPAVPAPAYRDRPGAGRGSGAGGLCPRPRRIRRREQAALQAERAPRAHPAPRASAARAPAPGALGRRWTRPAPPPAPLSGLVAQRAREGAALRGWWPRCGVAPSSRGADQDAPQAACGKVRALPQEAARGALEGPLGAQAGLRGVAPVLLGKGG